MGGGGGHGRGGLGDIDSLMQKAREELRGGEQGARQNVFLSFAYEDADEVNLLRGQAKNERSDIEFNDWSVREPFDSTRAAYIKQKIGERISQCSVTVVYVSENALQSNWINWEVNESIARNKKVIAVHKGDAAPANLPSAVTENKIKVVPWASLAQALKTL